ncbi:MAG: 16S rRNA (cytosine(1402)-N(4))-methyltransferase, partial [Alphaproteobacteria bacterium]|nr:16S rRNA (cytosine(1402)-N(4))-methyltransferase [Alphaproteobacteria bacterium]
MLDEVLDMLAPVDGGVYVDGTFGAGGYTKAILDAADCTVVAIDRDPDAQKRADG